MQRKKVESSNITSIGWENNTLEIEFNQGAVYQYFGVDKATYEELMEAPSKGKYLSAHIKGQHKYKRVK